MNAVGFTVFAGVRKMSDGDSLKEKAVYPDKMIPIRLDVTKQEEVDAAVKVVEAAVGENGLTALYNNAGVFNSDRDSTGLSVKSTPVEDYEWVFSVNYFGVIRVTKAFIPLLEKSKKSRGIARIQINTSIAGWAASPWFSAYSNSKHATEAFGASLRVELYHDGIVTSMINPGFIYSEMTCGALRDYYKDGKKEYKGPYPGLEDIEVTGMFRSTETPEIVSDALIDAVLSSKPQRWYTMGGMSKINLFVTMLPKALQERIMRVRFPDSLSKADFEKISKECDQEWFHPEKYINKY